MFPILATSLLEPWLELVLLVCISVEIYAGTTDIFHCRHEVSHELTRVK